MPFQRPTLADLRRRFKASIRSKLALGPLLPRSVLSVLADVFAGGTHHNYGHMDWISKQQFPDTADQDSLERQAAVYDITRRAATYAEGQLEISALISTGIPAGTRWKRADGTLVELDGLGIITTSDPQSVNVVAVNAGVDGNCDDGTKFTVASPISGLDSNASADGAHTGGQGEETDDALRDRLLTRMRNPPRGGSEADYIHWCMSIDDVTRVWVIPNGLGGGTVSIYIATDDVSTGPIPTAGKVTEVQNYIDTVRPVTADPTVYAPVENGLDANITLSPDTTEVRAAVEASLADYLRRNAEPGGTLLLSQIREAISIAAGETDHTLNSPSANVTIGDDELMTVGTTVWS